MTTSTPGSTVRRRQHANIGTPVLILHSEYDLRCNVEQGEHLFTLLRLLGKEVEMLRFPAESHELSRSGSPIEWFDRYLK
jgi:dipeptidyl aminopeptidase/acylaminoacyl peptidase